MISTYWPIVKAMGLMSSMGIIKADATFQEQTLAISLPDSTPTNRDE